jgi:3'-phosphoadenosine 5'-phosphosulfate sulfotransferase (PAPS reductase)/FAD synthetase
MKRDEIINQLVETAPNIEILNSFLVTDNKLKRCKSAVCSISGGSDSDIVIDICAKLDTERKVTYVFFDTGLEFQATKDHIKRLEGKYGVVIHTEKATKPIPTCCREFGVPFLSKQVSEYIYRLQRHNFKWEDEGFETLCKKYPKCKSALKWWCNTAQSEMFNIRRNKWLKEFIILNPPDFKISNKCCIYAKKLPSKKFKEKGGFDLGIQGVRRAEGGARTAAYKNCFSPATDTSIDEYRPVFWYVKQTKETYKETYDITHSDCYEVWGLPRTGCSGCPYARDFECELEATKKYEPKLYKALIKVFGKSYEYTRKYREFQKKCNKERNAKV